jgi:hypothetical protein
LLVGRFDFRMDVIGGGGNSGVTCLSKRRGFVGKAGSGSERRIHVGGLAAGCGESPVIKAG